MAPSSSPSSRPAARAALPGDKLAFRLGLAATLAVAAFLIGPVVLSVLAGLTSNYFVGLSSGLTLRWVAQVWDLYASTIWRSLLVAAMTLAVCLLAGVPAAWALTLKRGRVARAFEELLTLPVAVPGLATALALIVSWGTAGGLRGSVMFIVIGHVLFTLPFMVRSAAASMAMGGLAALDEAAATLGAARLHRFLHIVVPNAAPGILTGALTVLTLSVGEFNLTWLLHTPLTQTLPVGLADSYASMRLEVASAYTLVFLLMLMPLLLGLQWLAARATGERRASPKDSP
ncbi:ABC transporter permease [Achromobacter aloeverae]|uniref:ABC transporter permease n=1 Tax=Achromobacter aloeverae TaxID=1750518 RepID=A0A4Q1HKE7_9BURK|nr:ABC transporter permease subunit [Achromobacter aloeverae]RXN90600.1 ABC transporter permease [Achromobacter aloeverae]